MVNKFVIVPGDDFIWNELDLISFLSSTQGRKIFISTNMEGCCARSVGLYDLLDRFSFSDVVIETANPLEYHDKYKIVINSWHFFSIEHEIDSMYHVWTGDKTFGAIYARASWHRMGLASHLIENHDSISSVGFLSKTLTEDDRKIQEIQKLWQMHPESVKNFINIEKSLPRKLIDADPYQMTPGSSYYASQLKKSYTKFLIDVVAETYVSGRCFFPTEKTVRPMLLKKPFLLMGSKHSLHYLRSMGFRTFDAFWSEEYDNYENNIRYTKILESIDRLAVKSKFELLEIYDSMKEILEHNYQILVDRKLNYNIECLKDVH